MQDYIPVYIYAGMVAIVTLTVLLVSSLFKSKEYVPDKYLPYESGIKTQTYLFSQRFLLRHYLVALIFLIFDIEVIFLYPWAVVAKQLGSFAFWEIAFFLGTLLVGFGYVWRKGGLQWE